MQSLIFIYIYISAVKISAPMQAIKLSSLTSLKKFKH